jgi:hypothetical protein
MRMTSLTAQHPLASLPGPDSSHSVAATTAAARGYREPLSKDYVAATTAAAGRYWKPLPQDQATSRRCIDLAGNRE